LSPSTK